jgi:hypothetical protein
VSAGWRVDTTLIALPNDPGLILGPLSARARLFAQPSASELIAARPELTQGIRFGMDDAARQWFNGLYEPLKNVGIVKFARVLAEGVTLTSAVGSRADRIEMRLSRRAGEQLELMFAQRRSASASGTPTSEREVVLLDSIPLDSSHPIIVVVPIDMPRSGVKAIAARFDLALPSADESFMEAAEATRKMIDRSVASAAAAPSVLPVRNDAWSGYELVLRSDSAPESRRAAMNYVAAQTGAGIAHDLILVADDATLEALHKTVVESMQTLNREGVLLGWLMDYAAIKLCADGATAAPLPAEMMSVLTIHLGEAGRNTASLPDLIKDVTTREELLTRVIVENMISLEDSSPAARVRAFDYLAARNRAPQGYDPLGPLPQRRKALEQATTTQPTGVNP